MNSPYTKHLDATLDRPQGGTVATSSAGAGVLPAVPSSAPQPLIVQGNDSGSGGKAVWALIAIVLAAVAALAGWAWASYNGPTWKELRRYEALAAREGEISGRDVGWAQGRSQGRTEMQYLAKYERLRNQAQSFNAGWKSGMGIGRQMGAAQARGRYGYGYGGYGRGYRGYGYGGYYGSGYTGGAIAQAQNLANATGQPVDVIIN